MKYIITENQFDRILSDDNISYINKITTKLFNPIYPEIQDIVISKNVEFIKVKDDNKFLDKLHVTYNVYIYVDSQLDKKRELEIAKTIHSFIEDNFTIKVKYIEFDSVDFLYNGKPIRIEPNVG